MLQKLPLKTPPLQLQQIQQISQPSKQAGKLMCLDNSNAVHLGPFSDIDDMCSEDGPVYELLGGEIYVYEAGDIIKLFENRSQHVHPTAQVH